MKGNRIISSALLCILLCAVNVGSAENYLRQGLEWTVNVGYMGPKGEDVSYDIYYLLENGVMPDGEEILVVKKSFDKDGDFIPCDTIKVAGDQVYYYLDWPSMKRWELLYDFSISQGETVSVIIPGAGENDNSYSQALCCMGTGELEKHNGMKVLYMLEEDLLEYDSTLHYNRGEWIVGLGSTNGIISMPFFNACGGSTEMIEASIDGTKIYTSPSSSPSLLKIPESAVDESPEVWYRLDGTRIEGKPSDKGVYIRRQGSKAEKRILF